MPKNKFQDVIYTIIMASVMVYGMVAYNIVLNTGSMQNWVFLAVFHEWPIMFHFSLEGRKIQEPYDILHTPQQF